MGAASDKSLSLARSIFRSPPRNSRNFTLRAIAPLSSGWIIAQIRDIKLEQHWKRRDHVFPPTALSSTWRRTICESGSDEINPQLRKIFRSVGPIASIDQFADSTNLLMRSDLRTRLRVLLDGPAEGFCKAARQPPRGGRRSRADI